MIMFYARGLNTKKIYVKAINKKELYKRLQELYPVAKIKRNDSQTAMNIYPEPLEIIKFNRKEGI